MEASLYHAIRTFQDEDDGVSIFERLEELAPGLFSPLEEALGATDGRIVLLYIAHTYSKESKLLVLGQRFIEQKKKIAKLIDMPDRLYGIAVQLNSPVVNDVVLSYLEYQKDRDFRHYMRDQEMYEALCDAGSKSLRKEDGSPDFKGMVEVQKLRDDLLTRLKKQESAYKEEYRFVGDNEEELRKLGQENQKGRNLRVENNRFVK